MLQSLIYSPLGGLAVPPKSTFLRKGEMTVSPQGPDPLVLGVLQVERPNDLSPSDYGKESAGPLTLPSWIFTLPSLYRQTHTIILLMKGLQLGKGFHNRCVCPALISLDMMVT